MRMTGQGARFRVALSGKDAVDLLHRVTSNDVKGLAIGSSNDQCLLTSRGKIIVPFELRREAGRLVATGPASLKAKFVETIEKYVFSEDVSLEDLGDDPGAPIDEDARIRAGDLRWGVEVGEETIPWEARMDSYVSTSKGCYTGQEVIARIETYGQVPRRLVRLRSKGAAHAERPVKGRVEENGEDVGEILSVTSRPENGAHEAIAMVRKSVEPGAMLAGEGGTLWAVLDSNQ